MMRPSDFVEGKVGNTLAWRSGRGPMTASLVTPYLSGSLRALSRSAMALPLCLIGLVPATCACFQWSQCLSTPSPSGGPPTNQGGGEVATLRAEKMVARGHRRHRRRGGKGDQPNMIGFKWAVPQSCSIAPKMRFLSSRSG